MSYFRSKIQFSFTLSPHPLIVVLYNYCCWLLTADCLLLMAATGARGALRRGLDVVLDQVLPADVHKILNCREAPCTLAYTEITPRIQAHFVNNFCDKADLIDVLRASCNIPFYFAGNTLGVKVCEDYHDCGGARPEV